MRILVTGGAGFIGSHVVDAFVAAGHHVAVVDSLASGKRENLNPQATFYEVDVRDAELLAQVFEAEQPEVVDHHAAQVEVRRSIDDPVYDAQVNVLGTLNVLSRRGRRGAEGDLHRQRGRGLWGAGAAAVRRGTPDRAAVPVWREQVRDGGVSEGLPGDVRAGDDGAAVCERLRSAPGSARRGGGGGDLRGQDVAGRRRRPQNQRGWRADAGLRLRGRLRARERIGAGQRGWQRVQYRHWGRDLDQ